MSNKITILYLIVLALGFRQIAVAQNINLTNWKTYTAMHNTTDAATDWNKRVWVSSTGGINVYDKFDSVAVPCYTLNANSGLLDPSINVLKYVPNLKTMICGSRGGVLTIIDNLDKPFAHITGIRTQDLSNPTINDICLLPNTKGSNIALIAGGFGLVEFNLDKQTFDNSVFRIGDFSPNTTVNNIMLSGDTIWVSTPLGIAYTTLDKKLNVPSNWKTFSYSINGDSANASFVNAKIIIYQNVLYANFEDGIYKFNGKTFDLFMKIIYPLEWSWRFKDMAIYKDKLILSTGREIIMLNDMNNIENWSQLLMREENGAFNDNNSGMIALEDTSLAVDIVVLYETAGCGFWTEEAETIHKMPNSPFNNLFCSLTLDNNGVLYAISDNSQKNNTQGLMSFDGTKWINYRPNLSSIKLNNIYPAVSVSPFNNKIYVSTWGVGLLEMDVQKDKTSYHYWDSKNSNLDPYDDGGFTITGQTRWDSKGNLWTVSYGESGNAGNMIVMFDKDSNSFGFIAKVGDPTRYAFSLAIDAYNTKWMGTHPKTGRANGLYYFNENNTIEDITDDIWGNLRNNQHSNLPQIDMYTGVYYDSYTSSLWLATTTGLHVINNPSAVLSNARLSIVSNKLLASQYINDIFIDAIGNKWISTRNGIWVISLDGSELLTTFTTSNTPLPTNDIQAVTINPNNGIIYIGTKEGLFTAQSNVLLPQADYSIKTYPQPFNLKRHRQVIIEGLTTDSDVRIVTPGGTLVRRILTSSKNAVWDGKDENGNYVPVGIYLVIANSVVTKSSDAAKIVVVE